MDTFARLLMAVLLALAGLSVSSCAAEEAPEDGVLRVVVEIPPLLWPVRGLAPEGAEVTALVPPGMSPHMFEMTPLQARAISRADLFVGVGYGLSPSVDRAIRAHAPEDMRTVRFEDILSGEELIRYEQDHAHHDHDHGHDHDHDHDHGGGVDPHVWLDPMLMAEMVRAVAGEIEAITGEPVDAGKLDAMLAECEAIKHEYSERLADVSGARLVTHHDAYSYLVRDTPVRVAAVLRPIHSVEPTPEAIAETVKLIRERDIRAVFIEPQFSARGADRIAEETGVQVLTIDGLGDGDYPAMMRRNLGALVEGLAR